MSGDDRSDTAHGGLPVERQPEAARAPRDPNEGVRACFGIAGRNSAELEPEGEEQVEEQEEEEREYEFEFDEPEDQAADCDQNWSDENDVLPGPQDRQVNVIAGSGLGAKTIQAAGIFWSPDTENRARLGWAKNRPGNAQGLVIPYLSVPGFAKVRFDNPPVRPGQSTKPVRGGWHGEDWSQPELRRQKYGSPAGQQPHVYIPPQGLCPDLTNSETLLIITEGEKKALLLAQEGHPAIALAGVFNWHDSGHRKASWDHGKDERPLHPELAAFLRTKRRVGLCFDAPDMDGSNPEVIREAVLLAKALMGAGHEVVLIYVPHGRGEKTGIDDHMVTEMSNRRGNGIRDLLCHALPVIPSAAWEELLQRKSRDDLHPIDGKRLLLWAGSWIGPGKALRRFARTLVTKKLVTQKEVERFLDAVETSVDRSRPTEFPALCGIFRDDKKRLIACDKSGALEMDSRSHDLFIDRVPYGSDTEISGIRERIARSLRPRGFKGRFDFRQRDILDALACVAAERQFNPVEEYLNGLTWDGRPRIALLQDLVLKLPRGPFTELNGILLRRWFISAVARALQPGCKVDTLLILQGGQGVRKSTFFSSLAEPWFSDSPVEIDNKDGMLVLGKSWIIEWPELESMSRARDQAAVKAFISSRRDTFRPPYGRAVVEVQRSSIFVGTTNDDDFLTDETGNRRYWVIGGLAEKFNLDLLRSWREHLWAEAVAAFKSHEQWWLTSDEEELLDHRLADFEREDLWEDGILEFVAGKNEVMTASILTDHLKLPLESHNRAVQMRVAGCLKRNGFERGPRTNGVRSWVRKATRKGQHG